MAALACSGLNITKLFATADADGISIGTKFYKPVAEKSVFVDSRHPTYCGIDSSKLFLGVLSIHNLLELSRKRLFQIYSPAVSSRVAFQMSTEENTVPAKALFDSGQKNCMLISPARKKRAVETTNKERFTRSFMLEKNAIESDGALLNHQRIQR